MKTNCIHYQNNLDNTHDMPLCVKKNVVLDANTCFGCNYYRKKKSALNRLKTYNKKPKQKRVVVSKKTYEIVSSEQKGYCGLCGEQKPLQLHHILYRSEAKHLIDEPSNCIMLCLTCHDQVHSSKKKYQPLLLDIKKGISNTTD